MNKDQIIHLIEQKMREAENNSNVAADWHAQVLLDPEQEKEAFYQVSKAARQATLLDNLLKEIQGEPALPLWEQ